MARRGAFSCLLLILLAFCSFVAIGFVEPDHPSASTSFLSLLLPSSLSALLLAPLLLLLLLHHHPPRVQVLLLLLVVSFSSLMIAVLLVPNHHSQVILGQVFSSFNHYSAAHETRTFVLSVTFFFPIAVGRLVKLPLPLPLSSIVASPVVELLLPPLQVRHHPLLDTHQLLLEGLLLLFQLLLHSSFCLGKKSFRLFRVVLGQPVYWVHFPLRSDKVHFR